ncbi:MAG: glycosyltransferase [Pseudomonadota bacterium]
MIFVTVGTQLAFPALIDAVAELTKDQGERIIAQVGPDRLDRDGIESFDFMDPANFEAFFSAARVVIAHAGIGTVLSAIKHQKPLIVMPRRFALGEHRNDHQAATVRQLEGRPGIYVARTQADIARHLSSSDLIPPTASETEHSSRLIGFLQQYITSAA